MPLVTDVHQASRALSTQPIPYPPKRAPTKSITLQYKEKDVLGDFVKGCIVCHKVQYHQDTTVSWVQIKDVEPMQ